MKQQFIMTTSQGACGQPQWRWSAEVAPAFLSGPSSDHALQCHLITAAGCSKEVS